MGFFIKSVEVMFSYTKGRPLEAVQEDVFPSTCKNLPFVGCLLLLINFLQPVIHYIIIHNFLCKLHLASNKTAWGLSLEMRLEELWYINDTL